MKKMKICKLGKGSYLKRGSIIDGIPIGKKDEDLHGYDIGVNFELGHHSIVMQGVEKPTKIGDNVIVGSLSTIGHDDILGDNSFVSAHCILGGHVNLGKKAILALGVTVRNRITIGPGSFIGMGSNVVTDIPKNVIAYGNPCRVKVKSRRNLFSYYIRSVLP